MKRSLISGAVAAALSLPISPLVLADSQPVPVAVASTTAPGGDPAPAPADTVQATKLDTVSVEREVPASGALETSVAERRYSGAVTEVLGSEAIKQSGDSDAAAALKRVTGLTLVDGQYIYVRGLGERYSSVLLNGARIPSPDPTRRVVPLDLFPAAVLDSVVISKSTSAELPGQFGGGTVLLRTLRYPHEFTASVGISGKHNDGATGATAYTYAGGARDWTGFDNDARGLANPLQATATGETISPLSPLNPDGLSPAQLEKLGEQVAAESVYRVQLDELDPGVGASAVLGNSWRFGDDGRVGFLAALRYDSMWNHRIEQRRTFAASDNGLQLANDLQIDRTAQNIEASGFLSGGIDFGAAHQFGLTHMLLRQTEDLVKISDGVAENQMLKRYELRWVENELRSTQITGSHALPNYAQLDWQYTDATASREEPNTRRWRRDDDDRDGNYEFSDRTDSNAQTTGYLEDGLKDWSVEASMPVDFSNNASVMFSLGYASLSRERTAQLRSFAFDGMVDESLLLLGQNEVLVPGNIGVGGLTLEETTLPTDNYSAAQSLDAWYAEADMTLFMDWRLVLGVRAEDNQQEVITADLTNPDAPPVVAWIDQRDLLPSVALTWAQDEHNQWRLAYAQSVSRPDFRELSPAPFLDPLLDLVTLGNPDLETTAIKHYDVRWEHYFSDTESMAIGAFYKSFENPIEKTFSAGGSTQFINLRNALSATVYGIEFDVRHSLGALANTPLLGSLPLNWHNYHIGANYARIESSVELDPHATTQTTSERPLQGASPYVANLQLGYRASDGVTDWTLLYNVFGERIARAGVAGQPDVYEQPLPQLDFVYRHRFNDHARLSVKLGNLLDPKVELTQGDKVTREYHKGREINVGFKWQF